MVFLALTRRGLERYEALGHAIEPNEVEVVAGAVETIKEHHPGDTVWVEA